MATCGSLRAGLRHLQGLKKLQRLYLGGTSVSNIGVGYVQALGHLEVLDLSDTLVTDAGLEPLSVLTSASEA